MVAYYAHSHGFGHSNMADIFINKNKMNGVIITSSNYKFSNPFKVVKIPDEDTKPDEYESAYNNLPDYAHYLPKSNFKILDRAYKIIKTLRDYKIQFGFIDLSVETAALFRLASIPYAYNRLPGKRIDTAHTTAFRAAEFLYAAYPKFLETKESPKWMIKKTKYLGFISKYPFQKNRHLHQQKNETLKVLIVAGMGGSRINDTIINSFAERTNTKVTVIGGVNASQNLTTVKYVSYATNLDAILLQNDIVVASCGLNLTAEILAIKNKFIAIPESRPYKEQETYCKALVKNNLVLPYEKDIERLIRKYFQLVPNTSLQGAFCNTKNILEYINLDSYVRENFRNNYTPQQAQTPA